MQADAAWHDAGDVGEAERLLEKAVRLHPGSQEAHEHLAELHIRGDRLIEGLAHYDRLTRPPEWPPLTYLASWAAYRVGRFAAAGSLARVFLRASRGLPELRKQ